MFPLNSTGSKLDRFDLASMAIVLALAVVSAAPAWSQDEEAGAEPPEGGIPVTDRATIRACRSCHTVDDEGRMTRISWMRKTPEGWQTSIKRMVSLQDIPLEPDEARQIVRYLSDHHGLAPEEVRDGFFDAERRFIEHSYEGDETTDSTCTACHSFGRVLNQRRSGQEWEHLVAMHRGYYPIVDIQGYRSFVPPEDGEHPMDKAIAHLSETFPLDTTEWSAWQATMRPPRLSGEWALSGHAPGKGAVFGRVTISDSAAAGEFETRTRFTYARSGKSVERTGKAIVYTGFQWRGLSTGSGDDEYREVFIVERGWNEMSGRWFTGGYDETGADITLRRIGVDPVLTGTTSGAVRAGGESTVRAHGANLPTDLDTADVDLGPGVEVVSVGAATDNSIELRVRVLDDAKVGKRDLVVGGSVLPGSVVVYDEISRIRVQPRAGMARAGGAVFPKQLQQFEAVAMHDGPDGEAGTDDDLELGMIDASWKIEEYGVTYADDDTEFVGAIDQAGLFTPNLDGPNPERSGDRNNVGDVWVVASYTPGGGDHELTARAHLLVTVPLYMRWEPWKVAE
ncbi:MAG: quinohemoprotein amine dehydrogenase subunit alpha [Acidobacteriota bacterium]|nr:quinohemoprotein amine dehydrogenase subunit alpha [Acidobacteriota bacterium]